MAEASDTLDTLDTLDTVAKETALDRIDIRTLPTQIRGLINLIGITATYKLLNAFGGVRLNIPQHISEYDHPIAMVLGLIDANILCRGFNHLGTIDVPTLDALLLRLRISTICQDRNNGLSITHLTRKYSMTRRYITMLLRNHYRQRQ